MKKKLINENRGTEDILNLIKDEGIFVASEFVGGMENLKNLLKDNPYFVELINSLKGSLNVIHHSRKQYIEFPMKFEIVNAKTNVWNTNSFPIMNLIYDDSNFNEDEKKQFEMFLYNAISDLNIGDVDIKPIVRKMFKDKENYVATDFVNGKYWDNLDHEIEYDDNDIKNLYHKYMQNYKLNESTRLTENKKLENPIEFFYTNFLNRKPIEYKGLILQPTYHRFQNVLTWSIENPEDYSYNGELLKELIIDEFKVFCSMVNLNFYELYKKVNILTNLPQGRYYLNEKDKNYVEGILKNKKTLEFSDKKYVYSLNFNYIKNIFDVYMDVIEITTYGKVNGFKVNLETGEKTKIEPTFLDEMSDAEYDNYREWQYDDFYSEVMIYLRQNPRFFESRVDMFDLQLAFTYDQNLNETKMIKENKEDPTQKIISFLRRRYEFNETNLGDWGEGSLILKQISFDVNGQRYSISNFQNKKEQIKNIVDMLTEHNVIEPIDPYLRELDPYAQKVIRAVKTFINQVIPDKSNITESKIVDKKEIEKNLNAIEKILKLIDVKGLCKIWVEYNPEDGDYEIRSKTTIRYFDMEDMTEELGFIESSITSLGLRTYIFSPYYVENCDDEIEYMD
jgi:hypothetical protein